MFAFECPFIRDVPLFSTMMVISTDGIPICSHISFIYIYINTILYPNFPTLSHLKPPFQGPGHDRISVVFLQGAYLGATDGRQRGDAGQLQHQNRGEAKKMWRTHWLVDELVDIF